MTEDQEQKPKKRSKIAWLGWILWITTVGGLYFIRDEAMKRDAETQTNQRSLFTWMERVESSLKSIDSDKVVSALSKQDENLIALQTRSETNASKLAETFKQQEVNLHTLQAHAEANASGLSDNLKQQENLTARLALTLPSGNANPEEALKLADEAKKQGDLELALVYVANAIRNQPDDLGLLKKYTNWSLESQNPQIIQGTQGLLQDALYRVKPKDIPEVQTLLVAIAKFQIGDVVPETEDPTPDAAYAELVEVSLESIALDHGKLQSRIDKLSLILESLNEADVADPEVTKRVTRSLEEAQSCAMAHQVLDLANLRFSNLETAAKLVANTPNDVNCTAALSALQGAEIAVNQVWSVPVAMVTTGLRDKLLALPEKLRKEAETVQETVEVRDLKIARSIWDGRLFQGDGIIQNRINGCQDASQECANLLGSLRGPSTRREASKLNEEIYRKMSDMKAKQFSAYQLWATGVIEKSRKHYNSSTIRSNEGATNAFYKFGLTSIDQSILSPEVSQFFNAVFTQLIGELPGESAAGLQRNLSFPDGGVSTKKKLEEF
jgi:hypothetical protein